MRLRRRAVWLAVTLALVGSAGRWAGRVEAQPNAHEQHHPAGGGAELGPSPASPLPAGMDMEGMMRQMMGMMGGDPQKPLVPWLLEADRLAEGERNRLWGAAERKVQEGLQRLEQGFQELADARRLDDMGALGSAIGRIREGADLWETGSAVLRALSTPDGRPGATARHWFKIQMNLEPVPSVPSLLPWGVSWLHLGGMAALAMLAVGAVAVHFYHIRQSLKRLDRLTRESDQT